MRAGGFTIQQALTPDATSIIKQSVTLARRRGHAQVTPLHVAHTMLSSSPAGILRIACLQSHHSHPLQCKALELCFSVALNRLPASILASQSATSSSSLTQFPSISNALIAAFKRAQAHQRRGSVETQQQPLMAVKIELQQLIISILDDPSVSRVMREAGFSSTQVKNNINSSSTNSTYSSTINDDVMRVIDNLMNKKGKNLVIIGENLDNVESVVNGVMRNEDLLREVKFVKITLSLVKEFKRRLEELKCLVKDEKRVFVYVRDLEWVIENRRPQICNNNSDDDDDDDSVEEMVDEIGKMVNCGDERGRIRILGFASLKIYMKCRNGYPSLQNLWNLHAITLSEVCNLGLSLIPESSLQSDTQSRKGGNGSSWVFDKELGGNGYKRLNTDQGSEVSVCQNWNSLCSSMHKQTLNFTFLSPHSPTTCFLFDCQYPKQPFKNHMLRSYPITDQPFDDDTSLRMYTSSVVLETLNSTPNSASSSEADYVHKFKEFNAENFKMLCIALEKKVPLHKDIIPEIAGTILQCRSGMIIRRREKTNYSTSHHDKQETWLVFQCPVIDGAKKKIGMELAKSIFGSQASFVSIPALFSRKKRGRDEKGNFGNLIDRLGDEMLVNPHRVFLVEDLDEVDYWSQMGIKRAIEKGFILKSSGEEISLSDAIVILSCESLSSRSNEEGKVGENLRLIEKNVDCVSLDLNMCINDGGNDESVNDVGLLECVDRCIIFKL